MQKHKRKERERHSCVLIIIDHIKEDQVFEFSISQVKRLQLENQQRLFQTLEAVDLIE